MKSRKNYVSLKNLMFEVILKNRVGLKIFTLIRSCTSLSSLQAFSKLLLSCLSNLFYL